MSYYFSFTQFPAKEFFEYWKDFCNGKLEEKINEKREALEKKTYITKSPSGTWETNRDAWIAYRKSSDERFEDSGSIASWQQRKKEFADLYQKLKASKTDKETEQIVKDALEIFRGLFGKQNPYAKRILFVEDCITFSDSAKSDAYMFLVQLFTSVHHRNLDTTKDMPTLTEWYELFQNLKPEFFEREFKQFCKENDLVKDETERIKKECLELLFTIKDIVKSSRDHEWELWFTSEYNEEGKFEERQIKALEKKCREMYEEQDAFKAVAAYKKERSAKKLKILKDSMTKL